MKDDNDIVPRSERTPSSDASFIVRDVFGLWLATCEDKEDEDWVNNFLLDTFKDVCAADPAWSGDEASTDEALLEHGDQHGDTFSFLFYLTFVVFCYARNANDVVKHGDNSSAWSYVASMARWYGVLDATFKDALSKEDDSFAALRMADRRHAEHRAMKQDAIKYWKENIDPNLSAQKAATELDRARVVNLSHKKLAEVIAAERKKLRS